MPTAVALIGRLTPVRCLLARRMVCAACPTCSGPSVATLIAYSPAGPSTLSSSRRTVPRSPVSRKRGKRRGEHDRIAHDHVARGLADLVLRPGDRHHAHGSGERRNVEQHLGPAVGLDRDDARIERERRLRRRRAAECGRGAVAAGADRAARALHAVEQLAVEVADFRRHAALAEIVVVRRRRLVIGEVEDADVDGRDDDPRLLAGVQPVDLHRHAQRAVRPHQARQRHLECERARLAVDREPLQADRAAGHAACRLVERTAQRRHHIGARAPVAPDR